MRYTVDERRFSFSWEGLNPMREIELALSDWADGASSLVFRSEAPVRRLCACGVDRVLRGGRGLNVARVLAESGRGGGGVRSCAGVLGRSGDLGYPLGAVPLLVEARGRG